MCLICVEFINQRMTREEVRKALPEMIMFAKSEDEKSHFNKLLSHSSDEEFLEEVRNNADSSISVKIQKRSRS